MAESFWRREDFIQKHIHVLLRQTGPSLSPFNAWVLLKGLETLAVRVRRQTDSAATLAVALVEHPKIARLIYPGRPDHPQAAVAQKQMRGGSTLVAFEIKGGKKAAFGFQDALKLIRISNNLGDAKSLVTHPATTTHQRLTPAQRAELGIGDGLVRRLGRPRTSRRYRAGRARRAGSGVRTVIYPRRRMIQYSPTINGGSGARDGGRCDYWMPRRRRLRAA